MAEGEGEKATRAKIEDLEAKLFKAAEIGKGLLAQVGELQVKLEEAEQEKHEIGMKLDAKTEMEKAWYEELDHLRDTIRILEAQTETTRSLEKDNESLKSKQEALIFRERKLEERIQLLESQLEEAKNMSIQNLSINQEEKTDEEVENLLEKAQIEKLELVQEKQQLEQGISDLESRLNDTSEALKQETAKRRDAEIALEGKECEVSSYIKKIDELRETIQEQEVEIEQLKMSSGVPNSKGNSIFSEVEDRRHLVESQLAALKAKYENLRVQYDAKVQQLQRVKLHNVSLMNVSLSSGDKTNGAQVRRLEELLVSEKNKNKALLERIDRLLSKKDVKGRSVSSNIPEASLNDSSRYTHTHRQEYSYFSQMLNDAKAKNEELEKQLDFQIRHNLDDGDKLLDMSRKVSALESTVTKLRAQNYQLQMRLDDKKEKQGVHANKRKEAKWIFEDIRFGKSSQSEETPVTIEKTDEIMVEEPCDENKSPNVPADSKTKKAISFSDLVKVDDGGETEQLKEEKADGKKLQKSAPKRKYQPVIYADEEAKKMEQECKTQ